MVRSKDMTLRLLDPKNEEKGKRTLRVPLEAAEEVEAVLSALGVETRPVGTLSRGKGFQYLEVQPGHPVMNWRPALEIWWEVLGD